jgi:hypothetical protein
VPASKGHIRPAFVAWCVVQLKNSTPDKNSGENKTPHLPPDRSIRRVQTICRGCRRPQVGDHPAQNQRFLPPRIHPTHYSRETCKFWFHQLFCTQVPFRNPASSFQSLATRLGRVTYKRGAAAASSVGDPCAYSPFPPSASQNQDGSAPSSTLSASTA